MPGWGFGVEGKVKKKPPKIASLVVTIQPTSKAARLSLQTLLPQQVIDNVGTAFIVMLQSRDFKIRVIPLPVKGRKK